ncbi:prolactin-releasing peptide isoform X2 [Phodopus roborovskii]|uniref:Prlh protein n=1 Tax=Phodopus roborovskii TaxID=109678 RepID=A0AAU9ZIG1_PHORO|nr:prolactin-releasing peptide isoform X2 [Phodopus roborovskii]CAH6791920.1 Prlh [Phodopus roborovskii]
MASLRAWLVCLLLLASVLPGASSRAHQHSMETRTPDINPAWYTGRGIRPVGRFGRRRVAPRDVTVPGLRCPLSCLALNGDAKLSQHE